jgi:hypothetical protein
VEGERLSASNLLSLPKTSPKPTLRQHFVHICAPKASQKRLKSLFCAHFALLMAQKRKENKGFWAPTAKNLGARPTRPCAAAVGLFHAT